MFVECWIRRRGKEPMCILFDALSGAELVRIEHNDAHVIARYIAEKYGDSVATFLGAKRIDPW